MELKTEKVRPIGGATTEEKVELLLNQFALLIDELGHELGVVSKCRTELATLAGKITTLEQRADELQSAAQST